MTACVPDLGQPPSIKPITTYSIKRSFEGPNREWPADAWWTVYGDTQLNHLIEEALSNSPDLRIAIARQQAAQAIAQQSAGRELPTFSLNGAVQETQQSRNLGFPDAFKSFLPKGWHDQGRVTANLDWQLDIFGKNHAALAAATSEADASQVDTAAVRLALSTSVAAAYAELVRLTADRNAAADAVRIRGESASLVRDRVKNGLENEGALSQAEAALADAEANADFIDANIAVTRNLLAALLGQGPDRGLDITSPENPQLKPFGVPSSLDADLLGRRPDIVAARLRAEAAASRIDVARADFYPNIDLTAFIGLQSLDLVDLVKSDSRIGQVGPAIHLPIFSFGQIEGSYRRARASYDEAVATYDKTLTNALHEVADTVARQRGLTSQLKHSQVSLSAAQNSYRIAKLRYQGGLAPYLDVLTAENALLFVQTRVADLEAQLFAQDVILVRTLGGGFVEASTKHE